MAQNVIYIGTDPVAFYIGDKPIGWYGIMVALAVVTVVVWALLAVKRNPRLTYNIVLNAALVGIPSGIVFSRLLHVFEHWDYFIQHPAEIIGGEGLTIWGAVLGAAIGIWIYSRFSRHSFGYLADVIAPGIILAQAIGRVGCTLNGCCYGVTTDLPWAVVYTHPGTHGPIGIPVHPTQVYEIIYNLAVFGILLTLRKKFRPEGSLFLIYLVFYAAWRLGIDFIRDRNIILFGLDEAQLISIVVLIFAVAQLAWRTRWVKKDEAAVADETPADKPAV